jgi:hypothetical protein
LAGGFVLGRVTLGGAGPEHGPEARAAGAEAAPAPGPKADAEAPNKKAVGPKADAEAPNKKAVGPDLSDPALSVEADELYQAFSRNEVGANLKYKGKAVQLHGGIVIRVDEVDGRASLYLYRWRGVVLSSAWPCIICRFPDSRKASLVPVERLDMVEVQGLCQGNLAGNVELHDCRLVHREPWGRVDGVRTDGLKDVQQQQKKAFGPPPAGATLLVKNEQLTNADPFDKVRVKSRAKTYTVNLTAGKTYQIDMTSTVIDSYLRLENPAGQEVAKDDDSGGFPNARIVYPCSQTGEYRIIATTFAAGGTGAPTGPFTLKVQER